MALRSSLNCPVNAVGEPLSPRQIVKASFPASRVFNFSDPISERLTKSVYTVYHPGLDVRLGPRPGQGAPLMQKHARGDGGRLRHDLIEATRRMLIERGDPAQVSLRGIAARVGVTAPAIYRHFPDKDALLLAAAAEEFAAFDRVIRVAAGQGTGPFDALARAGRAYLAFGLDHPEPYRVLFGATGAALKAKQPLPREFTTGKAEFATLVGLVQACIDDTTSAPGRVAAHPAPDAFILAVEAWSLLHGLVDLRITRTAFPWPSIDAVFDSWTAKLRAQLHSSPPTA
jgi:AcrR family transcriptional regulator